MRKEHITLSDNYEQDIQEQVINFEIFLEPRTNGNAVWLPVKLQDGFYFNNKNPLHFCVGYHRAERIDRCNFSLEWL